MVAMNFFEKVYAFVLFRIRSIIVINSEVFRMSANFRQLQAFATVYRLGSLTRAAEELNLTQSAVSLLVKQLEEMWNARLFDRTTRVLSPTIAAHDAISAVKQILIDLRSLDVQMRNLAQLDRGRISFAATAGVASSLMPKILSAFVTAYPNIGYRMLDVAADQLIAKIMSGEAEFAIGTVDDDTAGVRCETLLQDRVSAIALRDGSFERLGQISWDELKTWKTISVPPGTSIRRLIDLELARYGKEFSPAIETSLLNTALAMTAHGIGAAVLPAYLLPMMQFPGLVAIPLVEPVVHRRLSVISREGRSISRAARAFLDLTRAVIQQLPAVVSVEPL